MTRNGGPSIAIVGGGFAGIAAAVKLKKAGLTNFTVFEKNDGIGGTWWVNRYPGAEVDVTSHLYSFSFKPHPWTRTHVRQAELQAYLEETVDEYDLRGHFRLGTAVESANWSDEDAGYVLRIDGRDEIFRAVISAVGFLNIPSFPSWPGLDDFEGTTLHTARWTDTDVSGKRVAVVGTGSSAVQVAPKMADDAAHVLIFQREPGWVLPKPDRDHTEDEQRAFQSLGPRRKERRKAWLQAEFVQIFGSMYRPGSKINSMVEKAARAYIAEVFADRPDLAEAVTPGYPYGGKRPVLSRDWYPTLLRPNVELVPRAVASVTANGIVDAEGVEHPVDVLVTATGFKPTEYVTSMRVTGRQGQTLQEVWQGEPQAFAGVTVPDFPNFFMLYGPNTNGGEIVSNLERQSEYAARAIARLRRASIASVEVRPEAYRRYNDWIQRALSKTVWAQANNYYKTASGRIVTQWPYGITLYGAVLKLAAPLSETTKKRRSRGAAGTRDDIPVRATAQAG
ncbi:flavin-containing monooxygenase [Microbacterium phyllosphaerae]|uniref:flavin-containing monooxygenase n=1 Tax=Microbacterium phyllosphaerae TaxID=124798 RepID=UPI000EA35F1E|nr:NAD(P)/FAD-dependent oxidoreductase [Microbacterium phyllosphaerae]